MLLVHKLTRLIPSPMDRPHHAQLPNLCCAKTHPQLHDKTATAKLKWHKRLKIVLTSSMHKCNSPNSPHVFTFATFINISATFGKLHSICNIFLLKFLATLTTSFLKHCNICNILMTLQHLQYFENSATPATFAIFF